MRWTPILVLLVGCATPDPAGTGDHTPGGGDGGQSELTQPDGGGDSVLPCPALSAGYDGVAQYVNGSISATDPTAPSATGAGTCATQAQQADGAQWPTRNVNDGSLDGVAPSAERTAAGCQYTFRMTVPGGAAYGYCTFVVDYRMTAL